MTAAQPPHLPLLAALAAELARSGVQHAVLCPGSRNAPILLALEAEAGLRCWSAVDERSAGFLALGLAKATGMPAVVCVTSGTALSNLLPAATEAHEAGVPLLILSADRPPELRDVGAGQTIDQLRALGAVTRWTVELDLGEASAARERWARAIACRAVAASLTQGRPGPVQLNVPLREPLTSAEPARPLTDGRPGGAPWMEVRPAQPLDESAIHALAVALFGARRGVIVAGRSERSPRLRTNLPRLAALLGWPLLADPMSGARRGEAAVASYDLLLSDTQATAPLQPDLVLRVGDLPVSKPLRAWLAGLGAEVPQVMLTPEAIWADEHAVASAWVQGDPDLLVRDLVTAVSGALEQSSEPGLTSDPGWLAAWRAADAAALQSGPAAEVLGSGEDAPLTEQLVARTLATSVQGPDSLVVGPSLPIRMLERWAPVVDHPPVVLSNRGANGIDGVVSTAFGVAAALPEDQRVVAYLGDLTLLYDQGGLAHAASCGAVQLVVVNNDGGRIFERLAVAEHADPAILERRILTPQGRDLAHLAAFYGLELVRPSTVGELRAALALPADRSRLIEVRVGAAATA